MNRRIASLATLFAAGAFVASAAPAAKATVRTSGDTLLTQKGCSADKDKQASCSGDKKADKKDAKQASCSGDKKNADSKDKKQASCSGDKGKKDAACGKGSCGSAK
jgi:hypothetical protein